MLTGQRRKLFFLWSIFVLCSCASANTPADILTVEPGFKSYYSGHASDVSPAVSPALLLVGGGDDRDDAMEWFLDRAGRGNIVVLRESGADGYNSWLLARGAVSVQSVVFSSKYGANSETVAEAVKNAEGIFFAGGDQSRYVSFLKGSAVLAEVQKAAARGVPIGGTSAGLAILGEFIFAANGSSIQSDEALSNPYSVNVSLDTNFLNLPFLDHVITDSHFVARNRMGRLLTFMVRIVQDGWDESVRGIGVGEEAAVGIDEAGVGTVLLAARRSTS